jgi:hypothetical protein
MEVKLDDRATNCAACFIRHRPGYCRKAVPLRDDLEVLDSQFAWLTLRGRYADEKRQER